MLLDVLRRALSPAGFNLVGVTTPADYDAGVPAGRQLRNLAPAARSVIVIGNGGPDLWQRVSAAAPAAPDPIDAYTRDRIEALALPLLGIPRDDVRVFYPFQSDPLLAFMRLGECAGLGAPSILGILVHPLYGPWVALRAALALPVALPPSAPLNFTPCATCAAKPCIGACPGGAVSARGWDVPACVAHRLAAEAACAETCYARAECVYGREYA